MTLATLVLAMVLPPVGVVLWRWSTRRTRAHAPPPEARPLGPFARAPIARPTGRPRLPGLTRTKPLPALGPPRRISAVRLVPPNAFDA